MSQRQRQNRRELKKMKNQIDDGGTPAERAAKAFDVGGRARKKQFESEATADGLQQQFDGEVVKYTGEPSMYRIPTSISTFARLAIICAVAAGVVVFGEVVLSFAFANDSIVNPYMAAAVAVGFALMLVFGATGLVAAAFPAAMPPRERERKLRIALLAVSIPFVLSLGAYLWMRDPSPALLSKKSLFMVGLALSTAAVAALLKGFANLYGIFSNLARDYQNEMSDAAAFEALADSLGTPALAEPNYNLDSTEPVGRRGGGAVRRTALTVYNARKRLSGGTAAVIALVVFGSALQGTSVHAQTRPTTERSSVVKATLVRTPTAVAAKPVASGDARCLTEFDITNSEREGLRPATAKRIADFMRATASRCSNRSWEFFRFSDDAFWVPAEKNVLFPSDPQSACAEPQLRGDVTKYRRLLEDTLTKLKEACRKILAADSLSVYQQSLDAETVFIGLVTSRPDRVGGCTSLFDALERSASEARPIALIATDGLETCRKGRSPVIPQPAQGVVIVVIVPPKTILADGSAWFAERRRAIEAVAPWAKVVPLPALQPTLVGPIVSETLHRAAQIRR